MRSANGPGLEHVPKKLPDFFDRDMLLFVYVCPEKAEFFHQDMGAILGMQSIPFAHAIRCDPEVRPAKIGPHFLSLGH